MTEPSDAIIIGAGHNGLVCAAYLASAGLQVAVLEARDTAGGMASVTAIDADYHFPGLAHTCFPLLPAIRQDLQLDRLGYTTGVPMDTVSLQPDGRHLTFGRTVSGEGLGDDEIAAFRQLKKQYLGYAAALRPLFLNRPPRLKGMDSTDKATLAKLGWNIRLGLGRDSMYEFLRVAGMNIYDVLNEALADDRLKGALAADAVLGHHMGPRTPGTVCTWLLRLFGELNGPLCAVAGGPAQLSQVLIKAAQANGAQLRLGEKVAKVLVENGRACGVELHSGEILKANLVVSNADPRSTFLDQVGARKLDARFAQRVTQIRGAGSVAKLHVAFSGKPDIAGLGGAALRNRFIVAPSMTYLERAFNCAKYGAVSVDPLLEVTFPSAHNAALAPDGHHVMSVNIAYAPYALDDGWEQQKTALPDRVISLIEQFMPGLASLVARYELLTPRDIEREYHVRQGHWHHGEMTIHQSFMMRPLHGSAQYDTPVEGLFLCGAGTHPGGGLTGLPGYNAARRVLQLRS